MSAREGGPPVAGAGLPLARGEGQGDWRWNELKYGEKGCDRFGMCVFDVYLDE